MSYTRISRNQLYGTLLASLSAAMFGLMGFLGTKLIQHHFSVSNMLFWRFAIATLWMLGSSYVSRKKLAASAIKLTDAIQTLIFAAMIYSAASSLFFISTELIGTGLAMAIFFSFPVFVTAFAWVFAGSRIDLYTLIALASICAGILLIKDPQTTSANIEGLLFATFAAFFYAVYVYRSRNITKSIDPNLLTLLVCAGNMIIFFLFAYSSHHFSLPNNASDCMYIIALGIIATALPIQFLLESMKYISPVKASILASFEVIVTLIVGWIFLNEHATILQMTGVAVILFGAIVIQREH